MHVQVQVQHLHFTYLKATPVTMHPQNAAVITEKVRKFYEASFQVQFQLQMQVEVQFQVQVQHLYVSLVMQVCVHAQLQVKVQV